ncbi:hypothetical protein PR048_016895 [Dryococelus australis]|uniref:Uncharacterized protein n=1 Tax=Dryococelus australis TaxID=614101 RepID=A0ABQ9H7Y9_9NEOP|nr:hypothetical protein PR048_016895 [Dryococelus australis]
MWEDPVNLTMAVNLIVTHYICCAVCVPANISETITDEVVQRLFGPDVVVAEIVHPDRPGVQMKMVIFLWQRS